jgi:hypothetical protein
MNGDRGAFVLTIEHIGHTTLVQHTRGEAAHGEQLRESVVVSARVEGAEHVLGRREHRCFARAFFLHKLPPLPPCPTVCPQKEPRVQQTACAHLTYMEAYGRTASSLAQ